MSDKMVKCENTGEILPAEDAVNCDECGAAYASDDHLDEDHMCEDCAANAVIEARHAREIRSAYMRAAR